MIGGHLGIDGLFADVKDLPNAAANGNPSWPIRFRKLGSLTVFSIADFHSSAVAASIPALLSVRNFSFTPTGEAITGSPEAKY